MYLLNLLSFLKPKYLHFLFKILVLIIFLLNFFTRDYTKKNFVNDNKSIPKISIFLPIYNKGKYLKRSIGSIQTQTLKDIEIILVNDCSTDNSLEILKEIAKNDSRAKIVNNKRNHGLLYSRAMGILKSKGEYLINLDPDDELNSSNNLEYLYNTAKKSKVDLICFSTLFKSDNYLSIKCSNYHHILRQPKLFKSIFKSNNHLNDYLIWNKLIKREIILKAFQFFKNRINSEKWNYHEDNIWSILINKYAQSMRCVNKLIYIYYSNKDSAMLNRGSLIELKNIIYRHEMFEEIFIDKSKEKYLIAESLELKSFIEENQNFNSIIRNNTQLKNRIINIFINYIKLNKFSKLEIKKIYTFLNNLSHDI
jgi:glycosyltransferase involved in cell wall biosynthesis